MNTSCVLNWQFLLAWLDPKSESPFEEITTGPVQRLAEGWTPKASQTDFLWAGRPPAYDPGSNTGHPGLG